MDNGHGGGKYGKWEVSLRVPDPMEPGLLEQLYESRMAFVESSTKEG